MEFTSSTVKLNNATMTRASTADIDITTNGDHSAALSPPRVIPTPHAYS
ncbi:hypothetical protein [Pyrobaculum calidifontis]|nr:hypothetical protein [Pyrobaculum calidifontis]